jgi:hypothetical protein
LLTDGRDTGAERVLPRLPGQALGTRIFTIGFDIDPM